MPAFFDRRAEESIHRASVAGFGTPYSPATPANGLSILYLGGLIDRIPLPFYAGSPPWERTGRPCCWALALARPRPVFLYAVVLLRLCGQE